MPKIKAHWIGQVSLEWEWELDEKSIAVNFEHIKRDVDNYGENLLWMLRGIYAQIIPGPDITVTKLHADLCRDDEPGDWIKEDTPK